MSNPSKAVALQQRDTRDPPALRQRRRDEQPERDAGSDKVQPTRGAIRVLLEIERIELAEGAKLL